MSGEVAHVLVLGSANVDTSIQLDRFPAPGETVFGDSAGSTIGGKGANQAVAARLAGAEVAFVGMLGSDANAQAARQTFAEYGVDTSDILTSANSPTGSAYIMVNAGGENIIVVASGANADLTPAVLDNEKLAALVAKHQPAVVVTQGETPAAMVDQIATVCQQMDIRFVLNLAPVIPVARQTLQVANPLVVNESEAIILKALLDGSDSAATGALADSETEGLPTGLSFTDRDITNTAQLANFFANQIATSVVITLGANGAIWADGSSVQHIASPQPARVVDTTGAGDAFVGALAARLAADASLAQAVKWGVTAGSLAVQGRGTVNAYGPLATLVMEDGLLIESELAS